MVAKRHASSTSSVIASSKDNVLVDERYNITIQGLQIAEKVTILSTIREGNIKFQSFAHFKSDTNGAIDLDIHAPTGGNYKCKYIHNTVVVSLT